MACDSASTHQNGNREELEAELGVRNPDDLGVRQTREIMVDTGTVVEDTVKASIWGGIAAKLLKWVTLGRYASKAQPAAARAITAETSMLARASEAALRAAGRADDFALGAKHAAGAGGRWAKFAEGVNPNAALREALSAPGARILPNDANSFRVVTDLGRVVGSRGETGIRAVVDFEGRVVTWFPVRP
jgi:hypothetical protein